MHIIKLKYSTCIFPDLLKVEDKSKMSGWVFVFQLGHEKGATLPSFFDRALEVSKSQKEFFVSSTLQNPNENIFKFLPYPLKSK